MSRIPPAGPPRDGPADAVLYSGNRHETVPRALFFDRRLTPLERNAWQIIRLRLNGDGLTAFPTYEELRPLLSSMPCAPKASHETVARAIGILRLTRWLSLVQRRRDHRTGRLLGNLYMLHDEPLTPFEAIQLDPEYLILLSRALDHAGKSVRLVGQQVLREMAEDPLLAGKLLPSRLHVLMQRMAEGEPLQDDPVQETRPPAEASRETHPRNEALHESEAGKNESEEGGNESEEGGNESEEGENESEEGKNESEESKKHLLRSGEPPASESEAGAKPAPEALLRNQERTVLSTVLSTVRNNINIKVRTVPRARAREDGEDGEEGEDGLRWPRRFLELKAEQQAGARVMLGQVEHGQRQAVLDEWEARCREGKIRHPAGYLFGIVQKALRGEFKVWAGQGAGQSTAAPPPAGADDRTRADDRARTDKPPVSAETAREYLTHLRAMLRGAPYLPGPP